MKSGVASSRPRWLTQNAPPAEHRGDGDDARDPGAADAAGGGDQLALLFPPPEDAHGSEEDQRRERVDDPVEAPQQEHASGDQEGARGEGAKHAPVEHPALLLRRNPELGEDEDEHEDVVDR
jgi:hypothetical protein